MKLVRYQESIYGIAEKEHVRLADGFQGGGEVLLKGLDAVAGIDKTEVVLRELFLQIQAGMEGDGFFPFRAADDDEYIHTANLMIFPLR